MSSSFPTKIVEKTIKWQQTHVRIIEDGVDQGLYRIESVVMNPPTIEDDYFVRVDPMELRVTRLDP